jgi:hypothetical protein
VFLSRWAVAWYGALASITGLREVLLEFVILVFEAFLTNKYFIVEIF